MTSKATVSKPICAGDAEAVEDEYRDTGSVGVETRSSIAEPLCREEVFREQREIEVKTSAQGGVRLER